MVNGKVNKYTAICYEHNVNACMICMVDDYHDWLDAKKARQQARKKAWHDMPAHEKFDLGGEA